MEHELKGAKKVKPIFDNFYEILGVPECATDAQINAAYATIKKMIKRATIEHGVRVKGKLVDAETLNDAYGTLISPPLRKEYDDSIWHLRYKMKTDPGLDYSRSPIEPINKLSYVERLYHEGINRYRRQDYDKALISFGRLQTMEKSNSVVFRYIAKTYNALGHLAFAVIAAEDAVELEPGNEENYLTLGSILENKKELVAARNCYKAAFEINPNNPEACRHYNRGSLVSERIRNGIIWFFKSFLPDPNARTFRYQDGLLTIEAVKNFARKFIPISNSMTFHCTGIW